MKVVQINSVTNGSTGKIMRAIHRIALCEGLDSRCFCGRGAAGTDPRVRRIETDLGMYLHGLRTRAFDTHAYGSAAATRRLVSELEAIGPDVVHIHNAHGYYLNLKILTDYLRREGIPVVWTLHDCWLFTGHCAYFDRSGCTQWESGCDHCPDRQAYPKAYLSRARSNFRHKKECLLGLENVVFVSPSRWLAALAQRSFLSKKPVEVIGNGIDLSVFCPCGGREQRAKMGLEDGAFVLLAVAADFRDARKGFADLMTLAAGLPAHMRLVLVGVHQTQLGGLPGNVTGIVRTEDIREMVSLYSMADVFLNPTHEDNYPTVNLEALACGAPVVTYNTGGCAEQVPAGCGYVVAAGDIPAMQMRIEEIEKAGKKSFSECCLKESARLADGERQWREYIRLYERGASKNDGG